MKNCFYLMTLALVLCCTPANLHSQSVAINTDGSAPDASAVLDLKSTDKGVLVPRMTAAQRSAIANPSRGLLVFQTDLDEAGNIYVADMNNHRIRKITAAGVVTTFAGTGVAGATDGTVTTATFNSPRAITMDVEGNFYIADAGNHTIRKITPGGIVSTLAGAGTAGNANGVSAAAYFNDPSGLVADTNGNLYVTDTGNHTIRKIILR